MRVCRSAIGFKESEISKVKVYVLDSGMKHSLTGRLEQQIAEVDEGQEWESFVYRQLLERNQPEDINFWRTSSGNEVDFVLARRMSPYALEVKRSVGTYKEKNIPCLEMPTQR